MYYLINVITILYGENLHGENAVQHFSCMLYMRGSRKYSHVGDVVRQMLFPKGVQGIFSITLQWGIKMEKVIRKTPNDCYNYFHIFSLKKLKVAHTLCY